MSADSNPDTPPVPTTDATWARCWRCAQPVRRADDACPLCGATRRRLSDRTAPADPGGASITQLMVAFGLLLVVSLIYGAATSFGVGSSESPQQRLKMMLGLECVDVALIMGTLGMMGAPPRHERLGALPKPALWAAALPALGLVLAVNVAYHHVLRAYLHVSAADAPASGVGITPLLLVIYCVQPPIMEELFFRYIALDNLRRVMGVHLAVVLSALMFGLAHVGVPLSIPMLALIGVALGYARVLSGGLLLPMVLHAAHNAVVLALR